MNTTVRKWGNSLGVRIPSVIAKDLMLGPGSQVEMIEDSNQIIIRPIQNLRLEDMLRDVTDSNIHAEIELGGPLGKEPRSAGVRARSGGPGLARLHPSTRP